MNSETAAAIIGASAGIVGAVVGGTGAVAAARVTASKGAKAAQEQWHRQSRREAYAKLILVSQDVAEDLHRFHRAVQEGNLSRDYAAETYARLTERMTEVRAAKIAAEIEGPDDMDRFTGPVLINLLRAIEGIHPDGLVEDGGQLILPEQFEKGFGRVGFAISDLTWCAREILSARDITSASHLRPPFWDCTR
ncbi:hypothetical protein [Streptomyces sp. NPDC057877]|uniref:hypothetical protein n=1 Tax=Streptomyces sp. NPDC057877 TaxID=3346269 RepID=UPI0036A75252